MAAVERISESEVSKVNHRARFVIIPMEQNRVLHSLLILSSLQWSKTNASFPVDTVITPVEAEII
jgi:hypothetical protein